VSPAISAFTNAVVAILVLFVPNGWVIAFVAFVAFVAVAELPVMLIPHVPLAPPPVLVGASLAISVLTNAVVASWVVLVLTAAVGAVGMPVRAGEFKGAKFAVSPAISAFTNAVVANCVVFVPMLAVGAVGMPVKAGAFKGAIPRDDATDDGCVALINVLPLVLIDRPVTTFEPLQYT
jgi:hypothetical protein